MSLRSCIAVSLAFASVVTATSAFAQSAGESGGQVTAVGCTSVMVNSHPQGTRTMGAAPIDASGVACPPASVAPMATLQPPKPKTKWYGWQTLIADGAALTMAYAAGQGDADSTVLPLAALGTYAIGAPLVHLANGSPGKMGIDLAARVGGPLLFGFGGYALGGGEGWGAAILGGVGVVVGAVGAVVVDATVLARKTQSTPRTEAPAAEEARASGVRISPSFVPTRGGGTLGAIGTF